MDAGAPERLSATGAGDSRKLTAVVYADMVGYTRLIGLDDAGTFARLRELRHDLIDPAMARHAGTLMNTAGDSLLVFFDSIIGAMRFAVEVQRGIPDFDGEHPADRRVRFRMGVNVGDVILDGQNFHGEGINVAARLQSICPPGAICVSRVVRDHVGNRLGLPFKELGAIDLKNVARAVEAFVVEPSGADDTAATAPSASTRAPPVRRTAKVALVAAALVAGGIGLRVANTPGPQPPVVVASKTAAAAEVPPLSIPVMAFDNLSGDPEQQYLADGIAEDLTTDLSHLSGAFVIARESAFSFRGRHVDIREIGRQLGVRYLLEGSVRKTGALVRINAQLIAAESGAHLWAERFDKPFATLGEGQDDVVARIGSALDAQFVNLESARRARVAPGNPAVVDLLLRARAFQNQPRSNVSATIASGLYEQALLAEPRSVPAMAGVASMLVTNFVGSRNLRRAEDLVEAAARAAPEAPEVLAAKFLILRRNRHFDESVAVFRRLLDVDTSAAGIVAQAGVCSLCWGAPDDAIPLLERTIRLNPRSPTVGVLYFELARMLLLVERTAEAKSWLRQALSLPASDGSRVVEAPALPANLRGPTHVLMAIADAWLDRLDEARQELAAALQSDEMMDFTVRSFMRTIPRYGDPRAVEREHHLAEGLRRAGLRDHLDTQADSHVPSIGELRDVARLDSPTPMTVPGGTTIGADQLAAMLEREKPLLLTTASTNPSIPGALMINYNFGTIDDAWQSDLKRQMAALVGEDLDRPVVTFAHNINRWHSRNLALRLIALGYRRVYWFRGGWEAWDAADRPLAPLTMQIQ